MSNDLAAHYRGLLERYGDTHDSAQYSSQESQEARFRILAGVGSLDGKRIIDFGCGTAHFASYLKNTGINCKYVGVDIVPEFLDIARKKHPEHCFGEWAEFKNEQFDYAFVSGVFNNKTEDNNTFYKSTITSLFSQVRHGIAFNMMSTYVDFQDENLFYIAPEEAFAFVKSITPFVTLRNDYLVKKNSIPFEFAIYAFQRGEAD